MNIIERVKNLFRKEDSITDGYHSFKELYDYRLAYNAALFNEWASKGINQVVKSKRHSDGFKCFDGNWFIVVAQLPTGQITNHYELKYWDLFKVKEVEKAPMWDGHTPKQALARLVSYLRISESAGV